MSARIREDHRNLSALTIPSRSRSVSAAIGIGRAGVLQGALHPGKHAAMRRGGRPAAA